MVLLTSPLLFFIFSSSAPSSSPEHQRDVAGLEGETRWKAGKASLYDMIPSGKHTKHYGTSPCDYSGKLNNSTISVAMFSSYISYYQRVEYAVNVPIDQVVFRPFYMALQQ